jgi:hypothetical protein
VEVKGFFQVLCGAFDFIMHQIVFWALVCLYVWIFFGWTQVIQVKFEGSFTINVVLL